MRALVVLGKREQGDGGNGGGGRSFEECGFVHAGEWRALSTPMAGLSSISRARIPPGGGVDGMDGGGGGCESVGGVSIRVCGCGCGCGV